MNRLSSIQAQRQTAVFVFLLSLIIWAHPHPALGQKITIEEAVMEQGGSLGPERLSQLQWTSDGGWSFVEDQEIKVFAPSGKKTMGITAAAINEIAGTELERLPSVKWTASKQLRFKSGDTWYELDIENQKVLRTFTAPKAANPSFSENGKALAYTRGNQLFMQRGGIEQQLTDLPEGVVAGQAIARYEFGISKGIFWSPDSKSLAFYQKDERPVSEYPLVDYGQTPAVLNAIRYPMAGQASEHASVGIYHIELSKTVYLDVNGGVRDDSYYITNLVWTPDSKHVLAAIVDRDQRNMQLIRFDAMTGAQDRVLFTESAEKYIEPEEPAIFLPDGSGRFLWFSERSGFNKPFLYSADGKMLGTCDVDFPIVEFLGFGKGGKFALVAAHAPKPTERHIYRLKTDDLSLTRITREEGYHLATLSPDGERFFDEWSSLQVANKISIMAANGKMVRPLLESENPLSERSIGKTEINTLKAKDGTDLWYRLITPPNIEKNKTYPVLVYVYNGPHVQLVTERWLGGAPLWMHSLAAEGYVVFTIDGRGSANRGRDFEQAIFRQLGEVEMSDQLDGVAFLKTLPFVDSTRMAVHGWSYGGFMTTSLMLRQPGVFQVGVAGGPVIDWSMYEVMYTERYMDTPETNPKGFERSKLTNYVDQLEGDLLMIHGTDDDVVLMQHNMKFLDACIKKGVLLDFFVYPGHPHNVRGRDRVHLMKTVLNYITERL